MSPAHFSRHQARHDSLSVDACPVTVAMCLSRPPATHDEQNLDRSARTSAGPTPTSPASACATTASKAAATARSSLLSRHIVRMEKRLAEESACEHRDRPRSPEIARDRPRSPEITRDRPRQKRRHTRTRLQDAVRVLRGSGASAGRGGEGGEHGGEDLGRHAAAEERPARGRCV